MPPQIACLIRCVISLVAFVSCPVIIKGIFAMTNIHHYLQFYAFFFAASIRLTRQGKIIPIDNFFPTDRRIKVRFSELKEAFPNLKSEMRIWYIMPDIAMQLKVTHTFDTQLFSQVSPFSTFQRRSLQNEKHLDPNLRIFLILKNFSRILEKFHFSISISRHFHFTFHSRKEWTRFSVHFSLLGKSERDLSFTFHFSKRVNQIFISLFTSRKKWKRLFFHFHFSNFQYPLSQDTVICKYFYLQQSTLWQPAQRLPRSAW